MSTRSPKKAIAPQPTMAELADRHVLYQESVQCVEAEIDFVDETFRSLRDRKARLLREDFCGTANTSCEWIRRRKRNRAIGVDIDGEVLKWGRKHNIAALSPAQQSRIELLQDNVLTVQTEPVDIILAMNFSYWCFEDRALLRRYFAAARDALVEDGVMFLDAFGGYESFRLLEESTEYDDFTYTWDQAEYNPIDGHMRCHIHFEFPDGSKLPNAFSYEWRLWTLPEIREVLTEAGFSRVTVYWEGTDEKTGEGDGVFRPSLEGDADPGWICYLSAEK